MIRVSLLGAPELTGEDGEPLHAVLAQPRRFGLLAFLAAEGGRGARRRDELLAMFWPELDDAKARRGLTYAIYFLRRELGGGVIVAKRDEVALDPSALWCDVWAFEEALDAGRLADALALYRGDFLSGFFADDAPGLDHWADAKRFRMHERARSAAWTLVERADAERSTADGIRWARRALEIAPDDERALRSLLPLLHSVGDTAGLLAEFQHFAREFEELHGTSPSQQTRALAESLYGASVPMPPPRVSPASIPVVTSGDNSAAAPADLAAPFPALVAGPEPMLHSAQEIAPVASHAVAPATASTQQRIGRRARIGIGAAIGIVALIVLVTWRSAATEGRNVAPSVVAVLPLAYHGSPDLRYTSDGLTTLLAAGIDNLDGLRTVNPRLLMSTADASDASRAPDNASAAVRRFGAGSFVLGDVTSAGRRLRVTVTMYESDARTGRARPVGAAVVVEGPADSLFQLADRLTAGLTATRNSDGRPRTAAAALKGTSSLPALRAFLDGERDFRVGRYDAAIVAYRAAVAVDSGFALAFFRMSQAANWTGDGRLQRMADEETQRLRDRLPSRERRRAEAWHESMASRPAVAEALYRDLVAEDPTDVEAWYYLADLVYHWGPSNLGKPASESRPEWERVLALEPNDASALIHLARLAAAEGDRAAFDSLTGRLTSLDASSDVAPEVRALRAFAFGDASARALVASEFAHGATKIGVVAEVVGHIMATSNDLAGVSALWTAIEHDPPTPEIRAQITLHSASVALGRGKLREADALIDSAAKFGPSVALRYRGLAATLPFIAPRVASLNAVRQRVIRGDTIAAGSDAFGWRQYLLGMVAMRSGDVAEAARHSATLDHAIATHAITATWANELAPLLRAEVAFRAGRISDALTAIGSRPGVGTWFGDPPSDLASAHERWIRAELYAKSGRVREALRVFASIPEPTGGDVAYAAAAHLRRAELYESLGEQTAAAVHYRRAVGYWEDGDPEVRELLDRARAGLQRMARKK